MTVVEYIETFMFDNSLFVVMELMDGGSLTNLIQVRPGLASRLPARAVRRTPSSTRHVISA